MSRSTEPTLCEDVREQLDAYLDALDGSDGAGEGLPSLPAGRREAIADHLGRCPSCARDLAVASRVRGELRALPEPELPAEWTPPPRAGTPRPRRLELPGRPGWPRVPRLPAALLAAAAALALLLVLPLLRPAPGPAPGPAFSAEEVARAERQARWAVARMARISARAGLELRDGALAPHLVAPVTGPFTLNPKTTPRPEEAGAPTSGRPPAG